MHHSTRRDFFKFAAGAAAAAAVPAYGAKRSATDLVTLGNTGVKVTRLAFGTGTYGGRVQRELGQEGFNRLVRYAYDNGVRFFETADNYKGMPQMLATALKGIPRDSYQLMTKYRIRDMEDPQATIDRLRADLNSDYVDILLLHCVRQPTWPEDTKKIQDAFMEAQHKKMIVARGASVHGLQGLRQFPGNKFLEVALLRTNHNGVKMDSMALTDTEDIGSVDEVFTTAQKLHKARVGILGMKLIGEGRFTTPEAREAAIRKTFKSGVVDAVTIGFENTAEIDEAIERINRALNS